MCMALVSVLFVFTKKKNKKFKQKIEKQRIKRFHKSSVVNSAPRADCHSAKITKFQTFIFIPLGDDKRSVAVRSSSIAKLVCSSTEICYAFA